uniref:RING-type domain-containing protein n=1 Tax=Hanusia phi TaxID=3032 RepID=A0A7S0F4Y5_9CRYP|mmetsp:Transcript_432/g.969  ORF Transcript_432/g.969 Transcript_432/m.969 type:complete len:503 (+) Transcript_432:81-1589(+)
MSVLFERKLVPTDLMTFADANLILVLGFAIFFLWFLRLLRMLFLLHRLNVSVNTGQVVRLQTSTMTFRERGDLFGEIRMLWRTNMQQQLLRARRICSPIDVNELAIPFSVEKSSVTQFNDQNSGVTRVNFKFMAKERVGIQFYWHVSAAALQELVSRFNNERLGPGENVVTHGRKKKRIFGRRYISVNQDRETHRSFELEMEKMDTMRGSETVEVEPRTNQSPLFTESDCCARSRVFITEKCDEWTVFDCEQGNVQTSDLLSCPHSQAADAQNAQDATSNRQRSANAVANNEASSRAIEEGSSSGEANFTLLIAAKVLGFGDGLHESAAHRNQGKDAETANLVLVVLQESKNSSQDGSKAMNVVRQIILTNKAAYISQEIFGCSESEDDGQEDCVICLSEPKDTTLLPCRHLCVCHSCFSRLELCPVCRSPFTAYLRQVKQEEHEEGGEQEQEAACESAEQDSAESVRAEQHDEAHSAGPRAEESRDMNGGLIFLNDISPAR